MSEENKDIKQQNDKVNEPVMAIPTDFHNGTVTVHDEIDDLNWDDMPIFGPKSEEEAIVRIHQAWEDRNESNKWMTSEQMWNHLYEKYPWLR